MWDRSIWTVVVVVAALAGCGAADEEQSAATPAGGSGDTAAAVAEVRQPSGEAQPPALPAGANGSVGGSGAAAEGSDATRASEPSPAEEGQVVGAASGSGSAQAPTAPVGPPPGQVGGAESAEDILARAEEAYTAMRSMEADFVQQVYVPLLDDTLDSRGKLYHRAPDRFLMRFTEPAGDVIVADGRYAWMYYPSNDPRQVMRAPLAEGGQQVDLQREFLSDANSRFSVTRTGSETVGGRPTHALTLRPRGQSPYREIRLWVDAENYLVRRFQITEVNESVRTIELSNLRPNVTLADDLFQFTPPPGAQVIEP